MVSWPRRHSGNTQGKGAVVAAKAVATHGRNSALRVAVRVEFQDLLALGLGLRLLSSTTPEMIRAIILMLRERTAPRSEVIRAILLADSPCCGVPHLPCRWSAVGRCPGAPRPTECCSPAALRGPRRRHGAAVSRRQQQQLASRTLESKATTPAQPNE